MGQKVNPIGLRLGINRTWDSRWYAEGSGYGALLLEDLELRKFRDKRLVGAGVSRIIIERPAKKRGSPSTQRGLVSSLARRAPTLKNYGLICRPERVRK